MKVEFLIYPNSKIATYFQDKYEYSSSNKKYDKQYLRIEQRIEEAENYDELVKMLEIKLLDHETGLREIKLDQLRVIHCIYDGDTIVLLGTFIKKTQKTPQKVINKNNQRIKDFNEMKQGAK